MIQTIPVGDLAQYKSKKIVRAGEIVEIVPAGCYVQSADAKESILRPFLENMIARYTPEVGDFWVVYEDGYQSLSPRKAFLEGYDKL